MASDMQSVLMAGHATDCHPQLTSILTAIGGFDGMAETRAAQDPHYERLRMMSKLKISSE